MGVPCGTANSPRANSVSARGEFVYSLCWGLRLFLFCLRRLGGSAFGRVYFVDGLLPEDQIFRGEAVAMAFLGVLAGDELAQRGAKARMRAVFDQQLGAERNEWTVDRIDSRNGFRER